MDKKVDVTAICQFGTKKNGLALSSACNAAKKNSWNLLLNHDNLLCTNRDELKGVISPSMAKRIQETQQ